MAYSLGLQSPPLRGTRMDRASSAWIRPKGQLSGRTRKTKTSIQNIPTIIAFKDPTKNRNFDLQLEFKCSLLMFNMIKCHLKINTSLKGFVHWRTYHSFLF